MEMRLLPLRVWMQMAVLAALLHVIGALLIDYLAWKGGFVYQVMGGQFLLLAGGVWLLIVLALFLVRMRRFGYLDPIRIILWTVGVAALSAPLKALGEKLMEPLLRAEYEAYPEKRAAAWRAYFRAQSEGGRIDISPKQQEEIIQNQIRLYHAYRKREEHLGYAIIDRLKILGLLGILYGLILGLLLRGDGTGGQPVPNRVGGAEDNVGSS
ncbi:MAG: hypothetical protein N2253_00350 [Bacteroidia bacterium]|nr:hypothetical protein [Bacteroidia bacterium]MCX7763329.1 hypothetical protein [Bacteroidia bacterium]MDW8057108.1 hypothetical protein [Bacteroidia bacterium]